MTGYRRFVRALPRFAPYKVSVPKEFVTVYSAGNYGSDALLENMHRWCDENLTAYYRIGSHHYCEAEKRMRRYVRFASERDAALFKLAFL